MLMIRPGTPEAIIEWAAAHEMCAGAHKLTSVNVRQAVTHSSKSVLSTRCASSGSVANAAFVDHDVETTEGRLGFGDHSPALLGRS